MTLANKGVGPASVRHVLLTADGVPVTTWRALVERLLGPGKYNFTESDLGGHVLAPNEMMILFQPHELDSGEPVHPGKPGTLGARYDEARFRIGAEICYCSTLEECWTLIVRPHEGGRIVETGSCPKRSATTFEQ